MTHDELIDRIGDFTRLEPGWDSYGGKPTTTAAIRAALYLVVLMPAGATVCPQSDGGVGFEWGDEGVIDIGPDGVLR